MADFFITKNVSPDLKLGFISAVHMCFRFIWYLGRLFAADEIKVRTFVTGGPLGRRNWPMERNRKLTREQLLSSVTEGTVLVRNQ